MAAPLAAAKALAATDEAIMGGAATVGMDAKVRAIAAAGSVTPLREKIRRSLFKARATRFLAASSETPKLRETSPNGCCFMKRKTNASRSLGDSCTNAASTNGASTAASAVG